MLILLFAALAVAVNPYAGDKDLDNRILSKSNQRNASNWAEQGYMIPHEALRRELFIGQRVLQRSFDGTVEWHVRNFFDWYRFFVQIVHGHHWSEEKVFFPAIIAAAGADLPPQMTSDHDTMLRKLEDIQRLEADFAAAKGDAAALRKLQTGLRDEWNALVSMMSPHLDEEENVLVPIITKTFTREHYDATVQKIIETLPPLDLLWELCPLLSWFPFWCTSTTGCSITAYDELLTKVPAPVRFAAFTFFMPRWEAATAALKSIETGTDLPYSRAPRLLEIFAALVALGTLYGVFSVVLALLRRVRRAVFGGASIASKRKQQ